MMRIKSFFKELKRRNIYKVAVVYGITGWVVVQVASIAANTFGAPAWVMKMIITIILLGFPIALIFAWAFEITPDGITRTRNVPESESITDVTGQKLNYWIIGLLSAALVFLLIDRFWISQTGTSTSASDGSEIPSVAVLPFEDFSPGGDQEWFADGLTEELLNSLARLQGLKVAARTSSFHFKNKNSPIQQIADTLDVKHIVEGSVRRADSTLRVTAQLIRASDGFHEWSRTYERNVKDVFRIQEDISENIASALNVYLDKEKREKMFSYGTRNVEAYNTYLKGRNIYDELHQDGINDSSLFTEAYPWFKKATELDPEFAAPYYYLVDPYSHYILDYPDIKVDSLTLEKAQKRMLANFDKAISNTTDPGQKLLYRFERTFLSNDWSRVPDLVQQLRNNPEGQRAYTMLRGGWTRNFLVLTGYAQLQYKFTNEALKQDPLDGSLKNAKIQALMSFAPLDSIMSAVNEYENSNNFFTYIFTGQIAKADSLIKTIKSIGNNQKRLANILIQAFRGAQEKAKKNFDRYGNKRFKNSISSILWHYAVGDIDKANNLAVQIDTTALGPQKLLLSDTNNSGGFMPFIPDSLPNVSERFKEAGVKIRPAKVGHIEMPRIVQKKG